MIPHLLIALFFFFTTLTFVKVQALNCTDERLKFPNYQAKNTRHQFLEKLLTNYDKQIRPPKSLDNGKQTDEPIEVTFSMTFMQLLDLDPKSETIKTSIFAFMAWKDERLAFDYKDYGLDCDVISRASFPIPQDQVWNPEIYLINAVNDEVTFKPTNVLLNPDGWVYWAPPAIFTTSCSMKVKYFPFDVQECYMEFESYYDAADVKIIWDGVTKHATIDCRSYRPNGEWTLLSMRQYHDDSTGKSKQFWKLILRREPLFYKINLVVPIVLFFVLSCFEFYLPSESGEKMTLSISILLGQTCFLTLVANCSSNTSEDVSLLGSFLLFTMLMVTISVVLNVFICNFHFRTSGTHMLTHRLKIFIIGKLAPILRMRRPGKLADPNDIMNEIDESSNKNPLSKCFPRMPYHVKSSMDQVTYLCKVTEEEENRASDEDEWHYVAMILDRLMLWIYIFISLTGCFYYASLIYYDQPELDPLWADGANPLNPCPDSS